VRGVWHHSRRHFFVIEPDLDVGSEGFDAEEIPFSGFTVFVFGIIPIEPVVEIEAEGFVGNSPADINL